LVGGSFVWIGIGLVVLACLGAAAGFVVLDQHEQVSAVYQPSVDQARL